MLFFLSFYCVLFLIIATAPPGSFCQANEFRCQTVEQCVPISFQCDLELDCQDGTDEIGCSELT